MKNQFTVLAAGLVLSALASGCATPGSIDSNVRDKYVGKPLDVAIKAFGFPTREMTVAGRKVYVWDTSTAGQTQQLTFSNVAGDPVKSTWVNTEYRCSLQLEVDAAGVVISHHISGQRGDCQRYGS